MKKFLIATFFLACAVICQAQNKPRTVDESNPLYSYPKQPVTIVARKLGERPFERNSAVRTDKSWLRDLRLTFKNTSGKPLIWVYIQLRIEEKGKLRLPVGIPLEFGSANAPITADGNLLPTRVVLQPSETTQLSLSNESYEYWMKYLKGFDADDVDHVSVEVRYAHFDDGTGWAVGLETRRNPNDLKEWLVVTPADKPDPMLNLSAPLSELLLSIIPPNMSSRPSGLFFASIFPAGGRFFSEPCQIPSRGTMETVECRWLVSQTTSNCYTPTDGMACDPPNPGQCDKPVVITTTTSNGTTKGSVFYEANVCSNTAGNTGDFCLVNCTPAPKATFRTYCGGGCNEQPDAVAFPPSGCVAPYENINGVCHRPISYQETCAPPGYDQASCIAQMEP